MKMGNGVEDGGMLWVGGRLQMIKCHEELG